MPVINYIPKLFNPDHRGIIDRATAIMREYARMGFKLTLRQLYYQFIAGDYFPDSWIDVAYNLKNNLDPETKNTVKNYKKLGDIIGEARMAGKLDWDGLEDRSREFHELPRWNDAADITNSAATSFRLRKWAEQPYFVICMVEKEALGQVAARACQPYQVPHIACKGYMSLSELWSIGQRLKAEKEERGKKVVIIHLGDHDPSGIDMTRDLTDRLRIFMGDGWQVEEEYEQRGKRIELGYTDRADLTMRRIALNMNQVREYNPPPNPAKATDARYASYVKTYQVDDSWELDALSPPVLVEMIQNTILEYLDVDLWNWWLKEESRQRHVLSMSAAHFDDVASYVLGLWPAPPDADPGPKPDLVDPEGPTETAQDLGAVALAETDPEAGEKLLRDLGWISMEEFEDRAYSEAWDTDEQGGFSAFTPDPDMSGLHWLPCGWKGWYYSYTESEDVQARRWIFVANDGDQVRTRRRADRKQWAAWVECSGNGKWVRLHEGTKGWKD